MATMKSISVYSYGQQVWIGNKGERNIKGEITAVCYRPDCIRYEVVWWKDQTKHEIWLGDNEFTVAENSNKMVLGFKHE